jgi:hypothetical protein
VGEFGFHVACWLLIKECGFIHLFTVRTVAVAHTIALHRYDIRLLLDYVRDWEFGMNHLIGNTTDIRYNIGLISLGVSV